MATRQNPVHRTAAHTPSTEEKPKTTVRKTPAKKPAKPKPEATAPAIKPKPAVRPEAAAKPEPAARARPPAQARTPAKPEPATAGALSVAAGALSAAAGTSPVAVGVDTASERLLTRAEADMSRLLESLNHQMNTAMAAFTEVIAAQRGAHEAVIRTRPIDRATAMFQRLITELMDDRLAEMLPTIGSLRSELDQRAQAAGRDAEDDFASRGTAMLDQVLASADVHAYEPRAGEAFDPLIHMAVGEARREDLPNDVVAQSIQAGYRSSRGKVIAPARVMVNRR